ncbi:hypothetical protein AMTR_s00109p00148210 [Amborella trichopoda]|uniref:PGG domain-containing protein n=1 Tax=Amborella trichopoda TaxID=13333 RepID=W1NSQ7_AMBTC|nr:hypothetical protein AMTR_s00109p00148210 [Amborella trichopoda]
MNGTESILQNNTTQTTPLHIAASFGHIGFAKEIMKQNPELTLKKDESGNTPPHVAISEGRADVMREILFVNPHYARSLTGEGETILYLCVKKNRFEDLKFLVENLHVLAFVNLPATDGNTVLHAAASRKMLQFIKLLVQVPGIEINALNSKGLTALDTLELDSSKSYDMEIQQVLITVGAKRSRDLSSSTTIIPQNNGGSENQAISIMRSSQSAGQDRRSSQLVRQDRKKGKKKPRHLEKQDWISKSKGTIMLVAVLIATITFQAGFTPPDEYVQRWTYDVFLICDTVGLVTSLFIIKLLMSLVSVKQKLLMRLLMVTMWISIYFTANAFFYGVLQSKYNDHAAQVMFQITVVFFNGGIGLVTHIRLLRLSIHWWRKGRSMTTLLVVLMSPFAYLPTAILFIFARPLFDGDLASWFTILMVWNAMFVIPIVIGYFIFSSMRKAFLGKRKHEHVENEDIFNRGIEPDIESGNGKDLTLDQNQSWA